MNVDDYINYTREQLVEEYLETRLASFVEACGVDSTLMPTDVSKDPAYWAAKDKDLHDMHYEIARRYNIDRNDCLWLSEIVSSVNFFAVNYKFKRLVSDAIKFLENKEQEKNNVSEA